MSESDYSEYIQKKIVKPLKLESTYTTDEMSGKDIVGGHDNIFGLPVAKRAVSNDDKEWDAVSATGIVSDAKDMGNVLSMYLAAGGQTLSYDQIEKIYSDGVDCGKTIFGTNGTSSLGWIKTKDRQAGCILCFRTYRCYISGKLFSYRVKMLELLCFLTHLM